MRVRASDEGENGQGRWQGDRDKKQDKENRKDGHGVAGSQIVTQSGITHGNEGG